LFSKVELNNFSDEKKEEVYQNFFNTILLKQRIITSEDMKEIDPIFKVIFSQIIPNDEE
jgi:hypothetical protein